MWKSDQSSYLPRLALILNIIINMVTCSTPQAGNVRVEKGEKERRGGGGVGGVKKVLLEYSLPLSVMVSLICFIWPWLLTSFL